MKDDLPRNARSVADVMVEVCHRLYDKGFVTANDGNVSVRLKGGTFLASCTSMNKGSVAAEHIVEVDDEGNLLHGSRQPSSELPMHMLIYKQRDDINAVVHAHATYATGFATARTSIPKNLFPEVISKIGDVPLADYGTPATAELANSLLPHIRKSDVVLLANHGLVACGKDIWDAYYKLEKVEHAAHIAFVARMLGGEKPLTKKDLEKLMKNTKL